MNPLSWFMIEKQGSESTHLLESKRHMPLVSLLLWRKMVAMHCFVWPPALQVAGWHTKIKFHKF